MLDKTWIKSLNIETPNLKGYLNRCLKIVHPEFKKAKASSGGKYHPFFSRAEGGLLHGHVRYGIMFVRHLCSLFEFSQYETEQMVIAMLLHDSFKGMDAHGKWGHTKPAHALMAAQKFMEIPINDYTMMDGTVLSGVEARQNICDGIRGHMNQWSKPASEKEFAMEKRWTNKYVLVMQIADYLSAQKDIPDFVAGISDLKQVIDKVQGAPPMQKTQKRELFG